MKSLILFLFMGFVLQTSSVSKLEESFKRLKRTDTKENQINFLDIFPNDIGTFKKAFEHAPLADESFDYISKFFALDKVQKKDLLKKAINIAINGKWEADAVNHFQHNLRPLVLNNVDLIYPILKNRKSKEIESFFYFLFSGPHPEHETIPKGLTKLKIKDKDFHNLIVNGHRRAIKDSRH